MPDYSLGKIYMIYPKVDDADEGDVYYGSTTVTLARRMSEHRTKTERKNNCSSKLLFDKYGVENCFIELVEEYPCETREHLNKKEGEYIRANKCVNKEVAGRTRKEWLCDNSDKLKEYKKQYYIENSDKMKEKHKEWLCDNSDKVKEYKKQYRIENRDKINEGKKQKANCPHCNKEMRKDSIRIHIKSGRCHNYRSSVHTID